MCFIYVVDRTKVCLECLVFHGRIRCFFLSRIQCVSKSDRSDNPLCDAFVLVKLYCFFQVRYY